LVFSARRGTPRRIAAGSNRTTSGRSKAAVGRLASTIPGDSGAVHAILGVADAVGLAMILKPVRSDKRFYARA
jgi:hypothetical protein